MTAKIILIVDDEPAIIKLAQLYLEKEGYFTINTGDGSSALQMIKESCPDLVILDIMLPVIDGIEVCRRLRAEHPQLPIMMVTARDEDIDKILGLEMGADDYLTKPFNPREMVARVKALLRRSTYATLERNQTPLIVGNLTIDTPGREVFVNGISIELRAQEYDLLLVLIQNQGTVLSRDQLLDKAWGYEFIGQSRTVDMHIAQLRKKLVDSNILIETVSGIGYKLVM